jgi:ketosteroid isomerase-like protein
MIRRRSLIRQAAFGLAAVAALPGRVLAASLASPQTKVEEPMSQTEANKRLIRSRYEAAQRGAVPNTLPGQDHPPAPPKAEPSTVLSAQDAPGGVDDPHATIAAIAGWHAQTVSPGFTSYGPMIAEGEFVVEEWETFFHGRDGTLYNNQYCWIKHVRDGEVVQVREYLDSHHAFVVLGQKAPWKALDPPRAPRRRWVPMRAPTPQPTPQGFEDAYPASRQFDLDPRLLRDPVPDASPAKAFPDTPEGHKALIEALHDAQAKGDIKAVDSFYAEGHRHFIAGEGPLGWSHLPVQDLYAPLAAHLAGPLQVRFGPMIAEGGAVFEEMDVLATLDNGSVYNNWHCFIHEVRGGKIVQTREYFDTHHFWVVLGRWAEWGRTPVPPTRVARRSNLPVVTATFQGKNPFLDLERWRPLPPV